jgi:Leucine-rich repeat (LRR) protein
MGSNDISGVIPVTIGELVNLEELALDANYLGSELGDNSTVTKLLSDALPSQIGLLTKLQSLDLKDNYLDTKGDLNFEDFATMKNLSKFSLILSAKRLDQNRAHRRRIHLSRAGTFILRSNEFTGEILPSIGNLPSSLTLLDLSDNAFVGTLPTEIGNLVALTDLRIARSDQSSPTEGTCPMGCLSGTIPTEFGQLVNLVTLWLFENALSGALPSELGYLTSLTECLININSLSGEIPNDFSSLKDLGTFD